MQDIMFERYWAMPNGNTFTIKPIKEFVEVEVNRGASSLNRLLTIAPTEQ